MSGYKCSECGWHGETLESRLVWIENDPIATALRVCPECRTLQSTIEHCCEEPGCTDTHIGGTPYPGGFKWHCGKHPPKLR
jgi:hypothetical protein